MTIFNSYVKLPEGNICQQLPLNLVRFYFPNLSYFFWVIATFATWQLSQGFAPWTWPKHVRSKWSSLDLKVSQEYRPFVSSPRWYHIFTDGPHRFVQDIVDLRKFTADEFSHIHEVLNGDLQVPGGHPRRITWRMAVQTCCYDKKPL